MNERFFQFKYSPTAWSVYMILSCIFGLILVFTELAWTEDKNETFYAKMCGPLSLATICEMFGQQVDPETIAHMAGAFDEKGNISDSGTSMKQLADVAHQLGFKAVGMKIDIQRLKILGTPCIAHTQKNGQDHFLVVEQLIEDKLRLIDVDNTIRLVDPKEFSKIWNGYVLVISKPKRTSTVKKPEVQTDGVLYDFGFAQHNQTITHIFKLKNVGRMPLMINAVESTCACTAALLSNKKVLPNQTAEIKVVFETQYWRGRRTATVKVRTNDVDSPVVYFTVTGVIAGLATIVPNNLYLKNIANQEEIQKRIDVYDPGYRLLSVKSVKSSSPYIKTRLQKVKKDFLVAQIYVTVKPGLPLGELDEKLTILTEGYRYPQVEVLVTGKVVGALRLSPDQFFLGFVKKGATVRRTVQLRKNGVADLKIIRVESNHPSVTPKIEEIQIGQEYSIKVTFTAPTSETGKTKALIKIHTNDHNQPLLEVPLYAIVK